MALRSALCALTLAGLLMGLSTRANEPVMDQRLLEAEQVYRKAGAEAALPDFERLLAEFEAGEDAKSTALATGFIGECHWRLGDFERAREYLDRALLLQRGLGDRLQEGKTLNVLGLLEWDLGNFDAAIDRFAKASAIGRELGDRKLHGATLNNLSMVQDELGDYRTSLEQYEQVLEIYSGIEFPRGEGDTLGNIGGVHLLLGNYRAAVDYYRRALQISERLESVPAMSQDHGNLGLGYTGLGRTDVAIQHFDRALELAEQAGMRQEQGLWLRGKANAQIKAGRYDLGLDNHRAALEVFEKGEARPLLLEALHDMGQLHLELGDTISAERYFQRAIRLAREIGHARGITINLLALGDLQYRHQRLEAAAAFYAQALQRTIESGEQGLQGESLLRLALIRLGQRSLEEAASNAGQALEIARAIGAQPTEAAALFMLAETDREQGKTGSALDRYTAARALASNLGDPDLLWRIDYDRALALIDDGQNQAAVTSLKSAVAQIESVRNRLREKRFQAGYLQDKHQVYIELVRLQLEMGRNSEAFSTAERLRALSYLEQSGAAQTVAWSKEQRRAETELRERVRQLQRILEEENNRTKRDRRQLALDTFSRELMLAEQSYQAFLDDLGGQGSRAGRPGTPVHEEQVRRGLRSGEALIEYVVGAEAVMMFVLTSEHLQVTSTPLSRGQLRARLELLRDLLQQRDSDRWRKPATALSRSLLAPVLHAGWLDGVEHLYLVPHGILNYLPFAVLPMEPGGPQRPVFEVYSLAYLPSAAALMSGASETGNSRSLLAMAPDTGKLRHAPEEARSVARMFRPHAELLAGERATESAFRDVAGNYQVLHLATHGYFNKFNPLLSGLELEPDEANDGLLEVHEILELDLDAVLVTLSACETGLGSGFFAEIPAGDDFVGLTRAFLQAGSGSVMATLWEVDDRSTVELMKDFYRRLGQAGAAQDMALNLAAAQRALRASEEFGHPYYWAPFVLVGATRNGRHARS